MSRKSKIALILGFVVALIVCVRIYAEHYLLQYVNKTLDDLDGYHGHVADIDLHIWRGAYAAEKVQIEKEVGEQRIPFIEVEKIDLAVHWDALLQGSIVGEIDLLRPKVNFVAEKKDKTPEPEKPSNWQEQVKELMPLKINHIAMTDGEIRFLDPHAKPKVEVFMEKLNGRVSNLTNSEDIAESLAATAHFTGLAMGSGKFRLDGKIDPYAKLPTFDLAAELEALQIKTFNDFLRAYANLDAEKGTFAAYTEISAKDGGFKGYAKPFVKELQLMNWKDDDGIVKKAWEAIAQGVVKLLENDPKDQVASRVPFSGRIENPSADLGTTILTLLRNAFVQALQAGIEGSVAGIGGGGDKGLDIDKDGKKDTDKGAKKSDDDGDRRQSRRD